MSKIPVLCHIFQVLQQYKVGTTPELGSHFRKVNAVGAVLPFKRVSGRSGQEGLPNRAQESKLQDEKAEAGLCFSGG